MDRDKARKEALKESEETLRSSIEKDKHVIKALKQLETVEESFSKNAERLRDWYSLHFPELSEEIKDEEEFVRILERGVHRDELDAFSSMAESSTGSDLGDKERELIEKTASNLNHTVDTKKQLEEYVRSEMQEIAPNLSSLLGSILAAKIVALEGSLESLAKQPASTIQMLGAEKALFRYLGGKGTPPKHGVLFEHEFVSDLPSDERGTMSRFLANKAAIAARMDHYGDKQKGNELRDKARKKYQELKD